MGLIEKTENCRLRAQQLEALCVGVRGCAWVCVGCVGVGACGCAWVCIDLRGCAWVCVGVGVRAHAWACIG